MFSHNTICFLYLLYNVEKFRYLLLCRKTVIFQSVLPKRTARLLLLINLILFIAGMFLGPITIMLVLIPLMLPLVTGAGLDLVHFGVVAMVNLGTGAVSPPFAPCIFVACRVNDVPFASVVKFMLPFVLFVNVPAIFLMTFVPELSTWLPNLIMGVPIM